MSSLRRIKSTRASGFTLIELIIAMMVTAGLLTVLSGVMIAVESARSHTEGIDQASLHSRTIQDRISRAVRRCGVYHAGAAAVTCGIATVSTTYGTTRVPDTLIVWSGDAATPLAAEGILDRLPFTSELTVFTPHPSDTNRLDEVTFPTATGTIDFNSATFATEIATLLASNDVERTKLTDRLRAVTIPGNLTSGGQEIACVRFVVSQQPTDSEIATATDEAAWIALPWVTGVRTAKAGLRQISVETELQFDLLTDRGTAGDGSLPSFGTATRVYLHEKE